MLASIFSIYLGAYQYQSAAYLYYVPEGEYYVYNRNVQESGLTQEQCSAKCQRESTFVCQAYSFMSSNGK